MNRTRLALAIGASLAAVGAAPSASQAATLAPATIDGVDYVRYTAAAGETNTLQVRHGDQVGRVMPAIGGKNRPTCPPRQSNPLLPSRS